MDPQGPLQTPLKLIQLPLKPLNVLWVSIVLAGGVVFFSAGWEQIPTNTLQNLVQSLPIRAEPITAVQREDQPHINAHEMFIKLRCPCHFRAYSVF